MERLTEWNGEQPRHAYYPRCFKAPCYGDGCKINDCLFETAVCDRLAAYEDTGLTPEEIKAPFTEDTMINLAAQALGVEPSRLREIAEAEKDGRVVVLPCKRRDELWTYGNFTHGREVYRGHNKDGCPIIDANIWMDDDDFCSHGERKEGADNG